MESADAETKARVDAMWELMNINTPAKTPIFSPSKSSPHRNNKRPPKATHAWMTYLGLSDRKPDSHLKIITRVAEMAKSPSRDVEVGAGEGDGVSEEGFGKRGPAAPLSGVDAVLEQIKKKPKVGVLEKTRKDWGEFKEESKGLEDELDAYRRSSDQYLEKISFLQRADYREFERERDARLALQARRRHSMPENP